jgi:hypothetical protein
LTLGCNIDPLSTVAEQKNDEKMNENQNNPC